MRAELDGPFCVASIQFSIVENARGEVLLFLVDCDSECSSVRDIFKWISYGIRIDYFKNDVVGIK